MFNLLSLVSGQKFFFFFLISSLVIVLHFVSFKKEILDAKSDLSSYEIAWSEKNLAREFKKSPIIMKYALNNTIIVTICNKGMAKEWLQQWYVSARRAGIDNIAVLATDKEAYTWVREKIGDRVAPVQDFVPPIVSNRWNSVDIESTESDVAHNWRSKGYEQIVTQRASILKELMSLTHLNILYSDTDIHWLKDPRDVIRRKYSKFDICIQREQSDAVGDYNCSGFLLLKYSQLMLIFLETWAEYIEERLKRPGFFTDQTEMNRLLTDIKRKRLRERRYDYLYRTSAETFDWDEFPSGINYFAHRVPGKGTRSKICRSKTCSKYVWKLVSDKVNRKKSRHTKSYIVHHNFAKSNQIKISRAKRNGLWLNLESNDWFD